ncbi:hypothetical protein C0Q70_12212 [Pomacea canaliculata]|uniref:CUB domain-containing protein n=1 Tax=Pomacea canaliculata TaxID=400727 RepID=A0A2T7P0W1_POMCA|nr:hypothetical protein C0Q70_12212 [Pomacea canaliculata]
MHIAYSQKRLIISSFVPSNGQCRYLLVAPSDMDVVEVEVQGMMVSSRSDTCKGDYISFYNGEMVADIVMTSSLDVSHRVSPKINPRRIFLPSTLYLVLAGKGDSTSALDLGRWCGVPTRRVNFRSTGP